MNLDIYNQDIRLIDSICSPIFKVNSNKGVLLIHGFTGSPHDMAYVAERLFNEGFTVSVPRLPGHGTSHRDFLNSTWKDWVRRSIDAYLDLTNFCDEISVVGLSMGALLAAVVASRFKIRKVVLAAPAFKVTDWRLKFTPLMSLFVHYKEKEPPVFDDPSLNKLAQEYWNKVFIKPAAQLYKLQKIAIKSLEMIESPTLVIVTQKDNTVPLSVLDVIRQHLKSEFKTVVLEKSAHPVTNDVEKEFVAEKIVEFLSN
ncbi:MULTISPECIES: alpha/beta hydrolase [Pseudothermotoga]|jgi:carboxylesterase|uniref:alpha/beta hydrolase n=1 Tax=Pseudothermotoga TaxID=1643951 RepID=UPI000746465B|nr:MULTISPECIES: alpha/beta fold hydrolase [Pseudothermotoga]KUK20005.1 MAG: Alpha/beta hydrolase fold domain-containing protein [Pseudothermotoga lettingae]HBJ80285.1 esterase [Pseudothermotoga sp.]